MLNNTKKIEIPVYPSYSFCAADPMTEEVYQDDWLIDDVIPALGVGMIFGPSNSGKSHLALSMASSIASGQKWFGRDAESGTVAIMLGEGRRGINKRLKAISIQHKYQVNHLNIWLSNGPIGLDSKIGFKLAIEALHSIEEPIKLLIIDTLSTHALNSKENDNGQMAAFISKAIQIGNLFNCVVIIVHHSGKGESNTARGASALKANIDFSYAVKPNGKKQMVFTCDKMKDGDDEAIKLVFDIVSHQVGFSTKGKVVTAACIAEASKVNTMTTEDKVTDAEKLALKTFNSNLDEWRKCFISGYVSDINIESKKKAFNRALESLPKKNLIKVQEDGAYMLLKDG